MNDVRALPGFQFLEGPAEIFEGWFIECLNFTSRRGDRNRNAIDDQIQIDRLRAGPLPLLCSASSLIVRWPLVLQCFELRADQAPRQSLSANDKAAADFFIVDPSRFVAQDATL